MIVLTLSLGASYLPGLAKTSHKIRCAGNEAGPQHGRDTPEELQSGKVPVALAIQDSSHNGQTGETTDDALVSATLYSAEWRGNEGA